MSPRQATLDQPSRQLRSGGGAAASPAREPLGGGRAAPLRVVHPRRRPERLRPSTAASILAVAVVLVVAIAVVATQALLAQGQFRLATLRASESSAQSAHQRLELQVAQLSSPQRIVWVAQHKLGMVVPNQVTYLQPVTLPRSSARP
ncbi:MAG: cell division protein FtsL [Actinomycetota bacterium]|nr:cell division protein FtsL [Actinomycetota bacterium]